jgi:hypothetical protein
MRGNFGKKKGWIQKILAGGGMNVKLLKSKKIILILTVEEGEVSKRFNGHAQTHPGREARLPGRAP